MVQSTPITDVCNLLYQAKKAKKRRQRKKQACIVIINILGRVSAKEVIEYVIHTASLAVVPLTVLSECSWPFRF